MSWQLGQFAVASGNWIPGTSCWLRTNTAVNVVENMQNLRSIFQKAVQLWLKINHFALFIVNFDLFLSSCLSFSSN